MTFAFFSSMVELNGTDAKSHATPKTESAEETEAKGTQGFVEDVPFNIKLNLPSSESVTLQVSASEIVQEIHRALMEREESCQRTCFSLHFNGQTLDLFADLKSIEGLGEGSEIKVIEEKYTTREVRNHVKHINVVLNSIKLRDAYSGRDQMSLSFLSAVTMGDILGTSLFLDD